MPPSPLRGSCHTSSFGAKQNHPTSYSESPAFLGPIILPEYKKSTSEHHVRIRNWYKLQEEENNNNNNGEELQWLLLSLSDEKMASPPPSTIADNNDTIVNNNNNNDNNDTIVNNEKPDSLASSNITIHLGSSTKSIMTQIVRHFARYDAPVDVKEVCESVEFVMRMRKRLVGNVSKIQKQKELSVVNDNDNKTTMIHLQDLCCGHGLTGMLFAASYGPGKVHVTLVDQTKPSSHAILKQLLLQICPWLQDQITYKSMSLEDWKNTSSNDNNPVNIVISTHACGSLTDRVLDYAIQHKAEAVAVMPCCYTGTDVGSPFAVKRALGVSWAADIRRSYQLQDHAYHVDFGAIPQSITPMNRIIIGELR